MNAYFHTNIAALKFTIKKAGGLSPASRLNHLAVVAALIQSNACSNIRASSSKSALP
jgi:hypothetical protein